VGERWRILPSGCEIQDDETRKGPEDDVDSRARRGRLGSTRTQKVDIRLVGATHRNPQKMVKDRQFRSGLYHRLNVVPNRHVLQRLARSLRVKIPILQNSRRLGTE